MRRRSRELIAVLVLTVLSPTAVAIGEEPGRLTFRAAVSDLWLQNGSLAKNRQPRDCVEVVLPGQLNRPPRPVRLIERREADWSAPERALASIRSANTAGDREWIVENFVPDEHAALRPLVEKAALLKRNQEHYQAIRTLEVTGSVELRGYTVLLTREGLGDGKTRNVPVALAKTASGWRQTNALFADETFDVVWAAVQADRVQEQTLGSCRSNP